MRSISLHLFAVAIAIGPLPAFAATASLQPSQDNTLFKTDNGEISNGSGPVLFVGNNSMLNTRRAVMRFSIADSIPANATIDRVELQVFVSNVSDSVPRTVTLHRVLADWGEGASSATGGGGAPSELGDATWLHTFFPDSLWANLGGDFDPLANAKAAIETVGVYAWSDTAMISTVQGWLDDPSSDFGWLFMGEESEAGTAKRIDSREHPTQSHRPILIVDFTPDTSPVEATRWGRVKALYSEPTSNGD